MKKMLARAVKYVRSTRAVSALEIRPARGCHRDGDRRGAGYLQRDYQVCARRRWR